MIIKNLWKQIRFYCDEHKIEYIVSEDTTFPLFCPTCNIFITFEEYESFIRQLSNTLARTQLNGIIEDGIGWEFEISDKIFRIYDIQENNYMISVRKMNM